MEKDKKKETAKAVNEGRPGYKHTPRGWIPKDWDVKTIGQTYKICNNLRAPISEDIRNNMKGPYPYYGPTKIQDCINEYKVDGKYALIGEDGDHFLKWKELPMTLLVEGKFNVNNHAHLIQGNDQNITEWFYYYFQNRELTPHLTRQGAGRYKLTKDSLSKITIALPPTQEQIKIVTVLKTWDEGINETRLLIEQMKRRNKGLMQELLTGAIRLPGFSDEWNEIHLGNAFLERAETGFDNLELLSVGSYGIYPQSQSEKRDISNTDKSKYKRICPGDIGYNTMRMWQGRSALADREGIVSPAYTIITPRKNQSGEFYSLLFQLPSIVHKFFRNSQGLVEDTLNCKFKDLAKVKVTVPCHEEQRAITNILKASAGEINAYERILESFLHAKRGLMQKLLTGELRVDA